MLNNFALYQFGPILSFTTLFVEEEETPFSLTCWASQQGALTMECTLLGVPSFARF